MRRLVLCLCTLAVGFALSAASAAPDRGSSADVAAVRKAFAAYRSSLLQSNGAATVKVVTRATVRHYGVIRDAALYAPEPTVRAMAPVDKAMVLRMRKEMPVGSLRKLTAEGLLAHGVRKGWVGKESVRTASMGEVAVSGGRATGAVVLDGKPAPFAYGFVREGGAWKFDLLAVMAIGNTALREQARRSGQNEDAMVEAMIAMVVGKPITARDWQPLLKR